MEDKHTIVLIVSIKKNNYSYEAPYQRIFVYDNIVLLSTQIMEVRGFYTLNSNQTCEKN